MKNYLLRKTGMFISLFGIILITGCSNIIDPTVRLEAGSFGAAEAGMGRVSISIEGAGTDGAGRTLFPQAPVSFSKYELLFTPKDGQQGVNPVTVQNGTRYMLNLAAGNWTVTAVGYVRIEGINGIPDGDYEAARGTKDISVYSYQAVQVLIDIQGGVQPGQTGILNYDIILPAGTGSAFLRILNLDDGTQITQASLTASATGSFVLDAGYYFLKIIADGKTIWTEVVHIYGGLTTAAAGPKYDFTGFHSIAEVIYYLAGVGPNTSSSPYNISLTGLDLEQDLYKNDDYLLLLFEALQGKYIALDLSGCTGSSIPNCTVYAYTRPDKDKLVSVILPDTLTSIGTYAFQECSSLTSIDLPDTLTHIGDSAFYGCGSLASIDLPDSLTTIASIAFYDCGLLTSIDLPDSLTGIGEGAFWGCSSLTSIDLPDSLTTIDRSTFAGCSSLTSIGLPDSLTSIGWNAFAGCSSLTSIDLPDSLTSIGEYAFAGCSSLTSIDLPDSLTTIGERAFTNCSSLTSIDLPDSLTTIGGLAFYCCTSLATLISRNTTPPSLGHAVLDGTSGGLLIYVPDTSVDSYKAASGWSDYANQIKPLGDLLPSS